MGRAQRTVHPLQLFFFYFVLFYFFTPNEQTELFFHLSLKPHLVQSLGSISMATVSKRVHMERQREQSVEGRKTFCSEKRIKVRKNDAAIREEEEMNKCESIIGQKVKGTNQAVF